MALAELYRETLLGHYKAPRNRGTLADPSFTASDENPLCGDEVTVTARVEGDSIAEVRFEARGCVICVASASLMTERVRGRSLGDARGLAAEVGRVVEGNAEAAGDVAALSGVRDYPGRARCATLPWTTLAKGIANWSSARKGELE